MITGTTSLPPQMLKLRDKDEKWQQDCMDTLETIGRNQYGANVNLIENYEMIRGKFIYSHYVEREDYHDLVTQLTEEFELPSYLRHYDIISQVINVLSGEYQRRPDIFRAKAFGEAAQSNFLRQKTELLIQYAMEQVNSSIKQRLIQEGLDPDRQDFASQEEQQQYQQQVQQAQQAMTPPEVEKYMATKWMDAAEIWAENQLEYDKQRFNMPEKEKVEFEDMLVADRCFRHFYLTPNGYNQETWNPVNTFYHKSPEVQYVENGDYVGRVFYLTISDIINRYGHSMTEEQLLLLEEAKRESYKSNKLGSTFGENMYDGYTPGTFIPSANYPEQKFVTSQLGFDPNNPEAVNHNIMVALGDTGTQTSGEGLFQVTEGYWMSQRRMGKYVYKDTETGKILVALVDETFDIRGIKELDNSFMEFGEEEQINTITWTWVNQVWKGGKINNYAGSLSKPIYFGMGPSEFQFKGDQNIYGAKLPVCGQVFSNRNADSMSLVDLMKPHQIGYNVAMNQLYEIMKREIGRFMLIDINMIPSSKDWGGPGNMEKFMLVAKQLGIGAVDASPSNAGQSNFAHWQPVDLDESARMISRLKIAEAFEQFALKQVGITPQRVGNNSASESATGVEQSVNQSYAQTESYFTNFSNYKRRVLQMDLEMAQFVESQKDESVLNYMKSDLTRAYVKIAGMDLLPHEFGVLIVDSREVQRQLETMRQLVIQNNTAGATALDLWTVISSNSPSEIKIQLEVSQKKMEAQKQQELQQQQQIAQQQNETMAQMQKDKIAWETQQRELDRENERVVAEIKAIGMGTSRTGPDADASGIPDALEVQKFNLEVGKHSEDTLLKTQESNNKMAESMRKHELERQKMKLQEKQMATDAEQSEKDREVERENMNNDLTIAKINAKNKKPK